MLNPTEDEVFVYLDNLRESGVTNMWGAGAYVEEEFDMGHREAQAVVGRWMRSFSTRHPKGGTT